jgi:hypothetical protein
MLMWLPKYLFGFRGSQDAAAGILRATTIGLERDNSIEELTDIAPEAARTSGLECTTTLSACWRGGEQFSGGGTNR